MVTTKWDLIGDDERVSLNKTRCRLHCSGCNAYLPTEGEFARHFWLPDVQYRNLGNCPHTPRGRALAGLDRPMPGDAVRLTAPWMGAKSGAIGVIGGVLGKPEAQEPITFRARTFRDDHIVSCGGGPGSIATDLSELRQTEDTVTVSVWRWKDGRVGRGNDDVYEVTVPVWEWAPQS